MRLFRNLPIKWKLLLAMVLTSVIAVALLSSALFFTGLVRLRHLAVEETAGLAAIIGGDCAGALAAGDANAAQKKLSDLAARTTLEDACLFTADGREFARYTRRDLMPRPLPPARASGEYFVGDYLELSRQIEHDGKPVGMIHLRTDTHTRRDRIKSFVGVSIVVVAVMALVAVLVLANWMERFVFSSMRELIRVARGVTERKDFTLRAAKPGDDETGVLTDAFNKMLGIIQERDNDSRASQSRLEKRVQERTHQLESANEQLKSEITERKRAEEALAQLNTELEERVRQRTAELTAEIAKRRREEEALRASEERYRTLFETMDEGFCVVEMLYDADGKAVDYRFVEINPAFENHTGLPQAQGKTIREMVPDHDAHWFEIYGKVARTGEAIRFENPAKAMGRYYNVFAFRVGGDGSQRVGILFNDITERKQAEETVQREFAMRSMLLENLPCIAMILRKGTREIVFSNEAARQAGGVPGETCHGTCAQRSDPCPFCLAPEVWATNKPRQLEVENQGKHYEGRWLPLTDDLYVHYIFDITKHKQAESALHQYAERLQTLSRSLVDAQETERRRIAQELHDEIGQTLTLLKLSLDTAANASLEQARERLQDASRRTRELMAAVRNLSLELRPSMLDDVGLLPALLWLGDRFADRTQVHIEHSGVESRRFSPEVEIAAYRIAQESLTNVVRHAATAQATIRLRADAEMLEVEVEDAGCGFDAAALAATISIGLHGMRERATALGGELTIKSAPGAGTRVTAHLPLAASTQPQQETL